MVRRWGELMASGGLTRNARGMEPWTSLGRGLALVGGSIALIGLVLWLGPQIPGLGRLPGDLRIERPGFRLYLPITTSILVSVGLSLGWYLFSKLR